MPSSDWSAAYVHRLGSLGATIVGAAAHSGGVACGCRSRCEDGGWVGCSHTAAGERRRCTPPPAPARRDRLHRFADGGRPGSVCVDVCVFHRVPPCACAHVMLLCVRHAGVQVREQCTPMHISGVAVKRHRSAPSARSRSSPGSQTGRMAEAERTNRASCVTTETLLLRTHPFLARSVCTTLSDRRRSESGERNCALSWLRQRRRLDVRWRPSHHHLLPLPLISSIFPPPSASRSAPSAAFASPASSR